MATAVKDENLNALKSTKSNGRGSCPRCQKRTTKGFIQMSVSKYGSEEKSARGAKHIKSKGRSMCATCIREVWTKLIEMFEEEVKI